MLTPALDVFITVAGNCKVLIPIVKAAGKFLVRMLYLETCRKTTMGDFVPADGKRSLSLPIAMKGNEQSLTILIKVLL
jgi:hypothetical protein